MSTKDIGIYAPGMAAEKQSGVGNRTINVIKSLAGLEENPFRFHLLGELPGDKLPESFKNVRLSDANKLKRLWSDHFGSGFTANRENLDLLHCPKSIAPLTFKGKTTITVHDLIFLKYPGSYPLHWKLYWKLALRASLRRADRIIAVSSSTARDIVELIGVSEDKIKVIPGGVSTDRFSPDETEADKKIRSKYNLPENYILYLGNFFPRKNIPRMLRAYHRASGRQKLPELVLAGPGGEGETEVKNSLEELGLNERTTLPGYVSNRDLPALFRQADFFVYPSLDEGFGLPVLQALGCGCPVLCSNADALSEVGDDLAVYFDPESIEDMADKLTKMASNPPDVSETGPRYTRSYDWENIGKKYIKFFKKILH